MKTLKNQYPATPKMVNVLFFSAFKSPSLLKEYKRKSETLSMAVKRELNIEFIEKGTSSFCLTEIKNENGCFYGFKKIKDSIVKKHINLNMVSQVMLSGSTLQIIYNSIW